MSRIITQWRDVATTIALPSARRRRFGVIYADPPWWYDDKCHAGKRGADYKYPCMSDEAIMSMPVSSIAADDSVLFMWATWPKLDVALDVMAAWGFSYKTIGFLWVKVARSQRKARARMRPSRRRARPTEPLQELCPIVDGLPMPQLHWGMGRWTRSNTEPCLIGVRGKPQAQSHGIHSVIHAPRGAHSAKPEEARNRIRALTKPSRVELFLRGPVPTGWWGWGNQAKGQRLISLAA